MSNKSLKFGYRGVSYKKALPPEKWPAAKHFLGSLNHYAKLSKEIDVGSFMREYSKVYG